MLNKLKEKLIGAQVLQVNSNNIVISINNEEFSLEIESHHGDCCGYAEADIKPLTDVLKVYQEDTSSNPVITDIKTNENSNGWSEQIEITFFGESQELFEITGEAGSSSGWFYGATVSIVCDKLQLNEMIAEY